MKIMYPKVEKGISILFYLWKNNFLFIFQATLSAFTKTIN
jgi:hypothetical protein